MKKRINCESCGKSIAGSTKHGWKACGNYQEKMIHSRNANDRIVNEVGVNNFTNVFRTLDADITYLCDDIATNALLLSEI